MGIASSYFSFVPKKKKTLTRVRIDDTSDPRELGLGNLSISKYFILPSLGLY
jgi:hypothetical protein